MIKIKNLNKYFYKNKVNEIHVINNSSLEFPDKGLYAILGESGSGKTTLLNVIGGLDDFDGGSITIDEFEISKYSAKKVDRMRNEKVGYIFQNYLLLQDRSVYYNLELTLSVYNLTNKEKEDRIKYVLERVGMWKYKKKHVSGLSGGQQQRVAIARALIKSPSLILADEPTGNLDEKNTVQIMNLIKKISKNTLVLLVSHEESIVNSYSDGIIKVKDGKIISVSQNEGNKTYTYSDEQTIYLQDYEKTTMNCPKAIVNVYSNEDTLPTFNIIYKNNHYYIESTEDVVLVNKECEIQIKNEKKKEIIVEDQTEMLSYDLEALEYVKNPSLSLKEIFKLARKNIKSLGKKIIFLSLSLLVMSVLSLLSIQSLIQGSKVNLIELSNRDSRIYNISIEKAKSDLTNQEYAIAFNKIYDDIKQNLDGIDVVATSTNPMNFELSSFSQINGRSYSIENYSFMPDYLLKKSDIIYGRLPNNATEIVVDDWVVEELFKDSTLGNFISKNGLLNQKLSSRYFNFELKIVGISKTKQKSIYCNKWTLLNVYPSSIKRSGYTVCSYDEYLRYGEDKQYTLGSNKALYNNVKQFLLNSIQINDDSNLTYNIEDKIVFKSCPFSLVVSEENYEEIFKSVCISNRFVMNVIYKNKNDLEKLKTLLDTNHYLYQDVYDVDVSHKSDYDIFMEPFYQESEKIVASRILIVFTIVFVSIVIVYFAMRSFTIKNIYNIGVYRAIGINKSSIKLMYVLEIVMIGLRTTFIGALSCWLVINAISSLEFIEMDFTISTDVFLLSTLAMLFINAIVGVLPVSTYLRLTPSQLISKYDI